MTRAEDVAAIDLRSLGAETMTTSELAKLEENLELNARYVRELRLLKLQSDHDNVIDLRENWRERIPNRKTIGYYRSRGIKPNLPTVDPEADIRARDHDDPTRLTVMVSEVARFTHDVTRIAEVVVTHARNCNMPDGVSAPIITAALRALKTNGKHTHVH